MRWQTSLCTVIVLLVSCGILRAQTATTRFDGLDMNLGNLSRLPTPSRDRSARRTSPAKKAKAAWRPRAPARAPRATWAAAGRSRPRCGIKAKSTFTVAEIDGPGAIQQIWMTPAPIDKTRLFILRFYWDGESEPSVEVPLGDFFACGWGKYCQINSLPVCVNPGSAFNCYWSMPFRKKAKITLENLDDQDMMLYYQVNYTLTEVPADAAYFHAQFRRVPKLPAKSDVHDPRRRPRPRAVRGHLPGLGSPQSGLVGRGRNQVLPGRRPGVSHHLRHRHGGLLLRLVQLREPGDAPLPDVQHALHRAGPGAAAGDHLRAGPAVRALPLAHRRSRPLPDRT